MTRPSKLGLFLLLMLGSAACRNQRGGDPPDAKPAPREPTADDTISLFITTQLQGTTEPCGCSSEPLGDVARIAHLVKGRGERALLLDAGGLRYKPIALPAEKQRQARLKADFLEETWRKLGAIVALQPSDLSGQGAGQGAGQGGLAELSTSTRLCSNATLEGPGDGRIGGPRLLGEELRRVGGVAIGVLGLAPPAGDMPWPAALKVSEPSEAAKMAIERLRGRGATSFVALTGLRRDAARRLARKVPELNLVVVGGDNELHDGAEQAEQVGGTLLVVPAIEGQRLVRVELHLDAEKKAAWTLRRTAKQLERAAVAIDEQLVKARTRLENLRKDPQTEPAFLQTTEAELTRLTAERARLGEARAAAPGAGGGHVTVELLPISRKLPRAPEVAAAMSALDRRIGEANLETLSAPPAAPRGTPSYVGMTGCQGSCHFHDDAFEFWQKTRHARAFPTLVEIGKDLSYDCVGCHAVGFDEAGGSNLGSLAAWQKKGPGGSVEKTEKERSGSLPDLRNVQCEACHGPGSLHAAAPSKNPIPIAQPTQERCLTCHTKDHSDTFDFVPYLRDIVGPGHGAEKRTALGSGPTGQELRSAALKKHQNGH
jgi:hypothetical protein